MTPAMERVILRSPLGQQLRAAGIAEAEAEERALLAEIDRLDQERDAAVSQAERLMAKERPELRRLQQDLEELKDQVNRKHARVEGELPGLIRVAHQRRNIAVQTLEKRLAEIREGAEQLRQES